VTINASGFGVAANGRAFELPWSDVKTVLEFPEYFLLVISRLAFAVIPKEDLPVASQEMIREAARSAA
jgi:hypothetical protein